MDSWKYGTVVFLLLTGLFAGAGGTGAQGLPGPTVALEGGSAAGATFADASEPALDRDSSELRCWTAAATVAAPFLVNGGRGLLMTEASYHRWGFDRRHWPRGIEAGPSTLHEISLAVTYRAQVNERWALMAHVSPQIASDLNADGLESGDWKIQGALIAERPWGDRWTVGFGAAYASTLGQPLPIPVVTFRYEIGGRFHAEGNLPESAELWWRCGSRTEAGFTLRAEGNLFHVSSLGGAPGIDDPQLQYLSVLAGPALVIHPGDGSTVRLSTGASYQSLRLCDGTDEIDNGDYDLDLDAFVRLGLEIEL